MSERSIAVAEKPAATLLSPAQGGILQRKCDCGQHAMGGECEECKKKKMPLQRKSSGAAAPALVPPIVHEVLRSPGQPLDAESRAFFEQRFGHDFSGVRVHTDTRAAKSAKAMNASGFTVGDHIVLSADRPPDVRRLLAHELTHVVQQSYPERFLTDTSDVIHEQHAESVASLVSQGSSARHLLTLNANLTQDCDISWPRFQQGSALTVQMLQRDSAPASTRTAEIRQAIGEMWGVVNWANEIGAEFEFTFWTSGGAMTLVKVTRTKTGKGSGQPVDEPTFSSGFEKILSTFVGTSERYFQIVLRRESASWSKQRMGEVQPSDQPTPPPEGRSVPLPTIGFSAETYNPAWDKTKQIIPLLRVPRDGSAEFNFSMDFDDDRVVGLHFGAFSASGGTRSGGTVPAQPLFGIELQNAVLAMTSGLGRRTAKFSLRGSHSGSSAAATWRVVEAGTERPAGPKNPDEAEAIVGDYRRMHQQIIEQWRKGVKDMAVYAGIMSAEQLALWLVSGWALKILGAGFRLVAPRLFSFIGVGSRAGLEYAETMVVRLSSAEKAEWRAIVRKAETEGAESLSVAERARINELVAKLESLIDVPLSQEEKSSIRGAMGGRYVGAKAAAAQAFDKAGVAYQIHHRVPLEWSHLYPGLDVNAGKNLIGVETTVHRGINSVWTRFRTVPSNKVTGAYVARVAEIIDKYFAKWYDAVPVLKDTALETEVGGAKGAALADVDALLKTINP